MGDYNIGPGAFLKTDPAPKENPFLMSAAEWLAVQVYVNDASSLPTNNDAFQVSLGEDAPPINPSEFAPLIACYATIHAHCDNWTNVIFPATVGLVDDISAYNLKVPTYYGAINTEAQKLIANPNDEDAQKALTGILDILSTAAASYQANAKHVSEMITIFANQTKDDKNALLGTDGTGQQSGLLKTYTDQYGSASEEVKSLTEQLKGLNDLLVADTAEYNHDVIVASTTPTYGWFFPFGTIAAAIIAGIYGDKALKAIDRINADRDKMKDLEPRLQSASNLILDLSRAVKGIDQISTNLNNALPIIQKIEGIWGAISSDLNNISEIIKNDIRQAPPIIMGLGVDIAINAWQLITDEANAYRVNAIVEVKHDLTLPQIPAQ